MSRAGPFELHRGAATSLAGDALVVAAARAFAVAAHREQRYGTQPFVVHLDEVARLLSPYGAQAQVTGYLHDVLEDTPVAARAIASWFGSRIAQNVLHLTDRRGGAPMPRPVASPPSPAKVRAVPELVLVVKAADRLANIAAAMRSADADRLDRYRAGHAAFRATAYRPYLCEEFWEAMQRMLEADPPAR